MSEASRNPNARHRAQVGDRVVYFISKINSEASEQKLTNTPTGEVTKENPGVKLKQDQVVIESRFSSAVEISNRIVSGIAKNARRKMRDAEERGDLVADRLQQIFAQGLADLENARLLVREQQVLQEISSETVVAGEKTSEQSAFSPTERFRDKDGKKILWETHRVLKEVSPGNKRKETAPEFIKRVYGEHLSETFGRAEISHLDPKLYSSLGAYISRHGAWPAELKLDLPTRSQRNDRWVERVVAGEDDTFASLNGEEAIRAGARARRTQQRRKAGLL